MEAIQLLAGLPTGVLVGLTVRAGVSAIKKGTPTEFRQLEILCVLRNAVFIGLAILNFSIPIWSMIIALVGLFFDSKRMTRKEMEAGLKRTEARRAEREQLLQQATQKTVLDHLCEWHRTPGFQEHETMDRVRELEVRRQRLLETSLADQPATRHQLERSSEEILQILRPYMRLSHEERSDRQSDFREALGQIERNLDHLAAQEQLRTHHDLDRGIELLKRRYSNET